MTESDKPRFRISAKQTAGNYWQMDGTVEYHDNVITRSPNPDDPGDTVTETLGLQLLSMIKEAEKAFRDDNRALISDKDPTNPKAKKNDWSMRKIT